MLIGVGRRVPRQVPEQPSVAARWLGLYVVVAVGRLTDLLPFAHSLPLAKMVFAIVLIAAFRGRAGVSPVRLSSIDLARNAIAFTALVLVSFVFSTYKSESLAFIAGTFLTVIVGFFISVKVLARWRDIRAVLKAFAIVGLILSAETLAGYTGGRAYVQSMYDTNDLAYVLTGVLPITLAFAAISSRFARIFWFAVSALIVTAVLLTQSRGGLLALVAIVLMLVWKPLLAPAADNSARAGARGVMVRAIVAAVLSVATWTQLPTDAQHRLGLLVSLQDDYNTDLSNTTGRSSIWKRNAIAGLERPIGFGVDTFTYVDGHTGGQYMAPHNSVLEVFVELGVLGLVLWLRLWILSWRSLQPSPNATAAQPVESELKRREQLVMAQALRICLVALFVAGFFLSQSYSVILWELLATCAAVGVLFGTHAKKVPVIPRRRHYAASP